MYRAEVRLLSSLSNFDRVYTYLSVDPLERGTLVAIPFGKTSRHQYGVVVNCSEGEASSELKTILFSLPHPYSLTPVQLGAAEFMAERTFCTFGDAARLMLPTGLDIEVEEYIVKGEYFHLLDQTPLADRIRASIEKSGRYTLEKSDEKKDLRKFFKNRVLTLKTEAVCHVNEKKEKIVKALWQGDLEDKLRGAKNKDKYKSVIEYISGVGEATAKALAEIYSIDGVGIAFLEKRGLVSVEYRGVERSAYNDRTFREPISITLSPEQKKAYDTLSVLLDSSDPAAALLYGVTGSGKTSVILSLIDKAVSDNKGVIMLVPEIALTAQSAEVLFSRYKDLVTVIHSGMSKGERHDSWEAVRLGKKKIVLGTRSAIFAPVKNLGLVVIDEEQDDSYKSDTNPRYHARDIARYVCAKTSSLLLMSSATPDVETFYNAKKGKYALVTLTERYGKAILPDVCISDVMNDKISLPDRLIGAELEEKLKNILKKGEQAVLFVNRRGLKKLLTCRDCKSTVTCPNCSVSMTLHDRSDGYKLVCHYCGYTMTPPSECPTCSSSHMQYRGYGTQKLEAELKNLFPDARILRLDADTTKKKLSHDALIEKFSAHEADILIGTQMVAKGHNFPDVTLVGVIMADLSLFASDYRANEHTFALMTQVIGRAGRGDKKGEAVIQTLNPYNEIIELCTTQDYDAFFEGEIELRRALLFPPFCSIGVFMITAEDEGLLDSFSEKLDAFLSEKLGGEYSDVKIVAYGPFDAQPYKLKNTYRRKLVVKYKNDGRTRKLFREALSVFDGKGRVNCFFDRTPTSI